MFFNNLTKYNKFLKGINPYHILELKHINKKVNKMLYNFTNKINTVKY